MVKVKICGIKTLDEALICAEAGADAVGFVFYKKSPRYISPSIVAEIVKNLPPFILRVGVFVNQEVEEVFEIAAKCSLDALQFHGDEPSSFCEKFLPHYRVIKAFRIKDERDIHQLPLYKVHAYLLDAYKEGMYGGTGSSFDWMIAKKAKEFGPIILGGGLSPENVKEAIRIASPYAVDVSTGVEEDGRKDAQKVAEFVFAAKSTR